MNLTLPLANYDLAPYVTVTREGGNSSERKAFPSVTISPSGDWVVVNDELQAVLCSFETGDKYRLHGTLLFRQYGFDSSMFCLLETNGAVSYFNSSQPSLPIPLLVKNLHVSCGGEMVHVSFSSFDGVVLVSSNCCIGCVQFDTEKSAFVGHFSCYRKLSGVVCCGIVSDSSLMVVLTREGLCGIVNFRSGVLLSVSSHEIFSELGLPSFLTPMLGVKSGTVDVVATFPERGRIHVFVTSTSPQEIEDEQEKCFIATTCESHLWSSGAQSYLRKYGASFILASVWQDMIQFSLWQDTKLSDTALVENEMSVPYVSGFWVDDLFVVIRADGMALPLSLCLNVEGLDRIKIVSGKPIELASCSSTLLCGTSRYFLTLTLTSMESLCSGIPGTVTVTDSNNHRQFLQLYENILDKSDISLIDIIPFEDNIAVINVKRSGECFALVPCDSQFKSIFLAHEEKADKVTCCLLYKRQYIIFVMGYEHGSVHVWISGTLKCIIPMAHTGVVDKIVLLPQERRYLDADFVSVCTERGTVVIHNSETFECTRILQSPCAPLTRLVWDPQTQYAFTVSGNVGNLWHVPTCRLERVFHNVSAVTEGAGRRDLLASFAEVGAVTIDRITICGRIHFSLRMNVIPLIDILPQHKTDGLPPACRLALSILFSTLKCVDYNFQGPRDLPEAGFNGSSFSICTVCAEQSAGYLLSVVLFARAQKNSPGVNYTISISEVQALSDCLVSSGRIEAPPRPEKVIVQAIPLLLQVSDAAKKDIRVCIKAAAEGMMAPQLKDLFKKILIMSSEDLSVRHWFNVSTSLSELDVWCYGFFVRMTFLGSMPRTDEILWRSISEGLKSDVPRLTQLLSMREGETCILLLLQTIKEYYQELVEIALDDSKTVVDAIGTLAFEGENTNGVFAINTLMSIASVEGKDFIEHRVKSWYDEKRSWRPRIITFFGGFIEFSPLQSYDAFPIMTEFLLRALDPHNPNKEERRSCLMPVAQVVRRAVEYLPNVSFQQHLQYLAVGNSDGVVRVINMKTTGIVASFVSHPEKILCVAYSGNTSTHDIAVLSEKMENIKIWHATRSVGLLGVIFAGHLPEFQLKSTVDIPQINKEGPPEGPDPLLMITKCRLRWLSPHCVELSSPWHDRIQLTVR
ncbi:hypothetical protein TraAM80_02565 [Trypanosoma rangeli]|uniref:Uncharacterized protein n=1 Tax=Trypanosoma rangeli TaxID=5698 RepID=A0A3R7M4E0_TRYRA|nr:uncharacterized protein TraAM80_02565 [Trypanosoma rangeli]RNF08823.1 hypothetical protein TraAM80_02565 [Trypanosoma rangeli]|eukprot:RNF08823.1 hypothetical protein TraAM80_02565 [Trypanosoma rangeli]